jgi:hypothetical protein
VLYDLGKIAYYLIEDCNAACMHVLKIHNLIAEQTTEWTDLVMRQTTELYGQVREHLRQRAELFQQVIVTLQQQQIKDLEVRHDRYAIRRLYIYYKEISNAESLKFIIGVLQRNSVEAVKL